MPGAWEAPGRKMRRWVGGAGCIQSSGRGGCDPLGAWLRFSAGCVALAAVGCWCGTVAPTARGCAEPGGSGTQCVPTPC